ncbi:MAG: sigma-54-dependent Fis family transcriptional regulator [Gammaproteobacteria bacterium]|nr:sigma-54-dependent Fis family transcriptional regulator [Gammaproteobacteria bacterium]
MNQRNTIQLLIVDDDNIIAESLDYVLSHQYSVVLAGDLASVKVLLNDGYVPDVALVDLGLPPDTHKPDEGFKVIKSLQSMSAPPNILVLSGQDSLGLRDKVLALGAKDFLEKPCDIAQIKLRLQQQFEADTFNDGIVGESEAVDLLRMQIRQFSDSPFPVLIEGESGCGKELAAKNLHEQSIRSEHPYLTLNCAAFNHQLLESQLFGHAKGAFTGASENKPGFFEEAKEGTLFLDEVGDLDLELQAKLLRVLENKEYYRLGETKPRHVNARIVTATNKKLYEQVQQGLFREDLFHRLSVLSIRVPSMVERDDDSLLLMDYFQSTLGEKPTRFMLDEEAIDQWSNYSFPGNVRELRNIVIRLMAKYPGQTLSAEKTRVEFSAIEQKDSDTTKHASVEKEEELMSGEFQLDARLKQYEKEYVNLAIKLSNGNMSKAAQLLGINRSTLYGRMEKEK